MIVFLQFELFITSLKNFLYPLNYYTGDTFCNVFHTFEYYVTFEYQYSSFFTNLFRYICIVHSEFLLEKGISVKVKKFITQHAFSITDNQFFLMSYWQTSITVMSKTSLGA